MQAFEHTCSYDDAISGYMRRQLDATTSVNGSSLIGGNGRYLPLRYGMNPHQSQEAELYSLQADMPIKGGSPSNLQN